MRFAFKRKFKKEYRKLPQSAQKKFLKQLELFKRDSRNPVLHVHKLKGMYKKYESINVGGDYRAIFLRDKNSATFFSIGRHRYLYKK